MSIAIICYIKFSWLEILLMNEIYIKEGVGIHVCSVGEPEPGLFRGSRIRQTNIRGSQIR